MRSLRKLFLSLTELQGDSKRIALAFALGIFWGFSPFLGFHTVLAIASAMLFRLNKVATLLGVWSNLPWILPLYYGVSTWFGVQLTGLPSGRPLPHLGWKQLWDWEFWGWLFSQWRLLYPAFVGSFILAIVLGVVAYPVALGLLKSWRRRPTDNLSAHQYILRSPFR